MASSSASKNMETKPLSFPWYQYPIALLDYSWVISIYVIVSFFLAVLIDGYLLPPFSYQYELKENSLFLGIKVLLQLALQGFIAVFLSAFMQSFPTPVGGIFGYNPHSSLGMVLRNPAIISIILFNLSTSLIMRLKYLYSRFNKNAPFVPPPQTTQPTKPTKPTNPYHLHETSAP
jgi:hypothetical protein